MGKRKISSTTAGILVVFAFIIDATKTVVELIPLVGIILSMLADFVAVIIFSIWLSHLECSLWSPKNAGGTIIATALGTILPTWTVRISSLVLSEREDIKPKIINRPRGKRFHL